MIFDFNPLRSQFINDYGSISKNFECVDVLGNPSIKVNIHLILFFMSLFATIFLFSLSRKKNKDGTKESKKTTKQKIFLVLSIVMAISSFSNIIIYGYLYFSCYGMQYGKWYSKLSDTPDGINDYNNYRFTQNLINTISNSRRNRR